MDHVIGKRCPHCEARDVARQVFTIEATVQLTTNQPDLTVFEIAKSVADIVEHIDKSGMEYRDVKVSDLFVVMPRHMEAMQERAATKARLQ